MNKNKNRNKTTKTRSNNQPQRTVDDSSTTSAKAVDKTKAAAKSTATAENKPPASSTPIEKMDTDLPPDPPPAQVKTTSRPKLNGAAQKRLKFFRSQGLPYEEALEKAKTPAFQNGQRAYQAKKAERAGDEQTKPDVKSTAPQEPKQSGEMRNKRNRSDNSITPKSHKKVKTANKNPGNGKPPTRARRNRERTRRRGFQRNPPMLPQSIATRLVSRTRTILTRC